MYRVLFAEDELLVRLGLQNSIQWKDYHMELAAQADNGTEAFQLFLEMHPDVVITDIRMDGMDGVELVKKVREEDRECAIIVISSMDDFEILRKLIPYNIIGYILKASMTMDEIHGVLDKTVHYLEEIGRHWEDSSESKTEDAFYLGNYLLGRESVWEGEEAISQMIFLGLKKEDQDKINELAMKFVFDLARRQFPEVLIAETGKKEFCLLFSEAQKNPEEGVRRINRSLEEFLGVHFHMEMGSRRKGEALEDLYKRLKRLESGENEEGQNDRLIEDAISYMYAHFRETLTLTDVSAVLGISPSYFSHLFKKRTEKNYVEYLNEIRLNSVMEDLKNSDFKISVIAEKNGFHNFEYFSRFFKKATGSSPVKWRQENR